MHALVFNVGKMMTICKMEKKLMKGKIRWEVEEGDIDPLPSIILDKMDEVRTRNRMEKIKYASLLNAVSIQTPSSISSFSQEKEDMEISGYPSEQEEGPADNSAAPANILMSKITSGSKRKIVENNSVHEGQNIEEYSTAHPLDPAIVESSKITKKNVEDYRVHDSQPMENGISEHS